MHYDIPEEDDAAGSTRILSTLTDWFETIEEVELTESDRYALAGIAQYLEEFKQDAMDRGVASEDFDDWMQIDVLENWSALMEASEEEDAMTQNPVDAFEAFVHGGEQRLFLQMLKHCLQVTQQSA